MSYQVTVLPSGRSFEVEPDETILDAGLRHGIVLPYGCKNGACGSCRARVTHGCIEQGPHQPQALRKEDALQGALSNFEHRAGGAGCGGCAIAASGQ